MQRKHVAVGDGGSNSTTRSDGDICVITTALRMYNTCCRMTVLQPIAADAIIRRRGLAFPSPSHVGVPASGTWQ